uniref:Gag polyprotein n=1 Tax=Pelusios castaneus TaxID=367368 RepID=A0A8C8S6K3_9SAUR
MWQKLGKELQIREHSALSIPKGLIATWRTVYTVIRTLHPAEQILQEASVAFDPRAYQGPEGTLLSAGIPPEEDFEPIYAIVPELPDPPDAEDLYQVMDGNEPDAPLTSGVTDLNTKPGKPDLYPPLTPIKALVASAPTAEDVLQTQRSQAISRSSVIDSPPFASSVTAAPPCKLSMMAQTPNEHVSALSECRREALRRGDVQLLQAFPVVYSPNKPARHEALPYELVKELRKSVKEYGLQSSYTMNLIVAISDSYVMAPCDWRALLRLLLSPAQYAVWDTEYRDFVTSQVMENITNAVTVGMDELLGQGQYAMPQAQAQLTRVAFTQAGSLTLRALRQVPDASRRETSFAVIRQGPQESYVSFLDRLQTAVQRQIDSEEAQHLLLFQLAIENANADCKKVLDPLRNKAKTLTELIKACQNVGSEQFKAEMLASALAQQLTVGRAAVKCFSCGKEGHMKRDCLRKGGNRNQLRRDGVPSQPCPRCQRGFHWGNQCQSRFDVRGNPLAPLPGNARRGARSGAPKFMNRATGKTFVGQVEAPQTAAHGTPFLASAQPPPAAPGWTWPLPNQP